MRKAQTEMMGLVILVVLISIVGIFAIRFLLSDKESVGPEVKLQTQAENIQSSILKLNIDGKSMSDIFSECCNNNCEFLANELPKLINSTLPGQKYEFELLSWARSCYKTSTKCVQRVSSNGIISSNNQFYSLQLSLCY